MTVTHRVAIIGSGFGGLYQVATGILSEGEIAPPTRGILRLHAGFKNSVTTVPHRAIGFVGRGRAERAISLREARARQSPARAPRGR